MVSGLHPTTELVIANLNLDVRQLDTVSLFKRLLGDNVTQIVLEPHELE